jgi:hypothetical protein
MAHKASVTASSPATDCERVGRYPLGIGRASSGPTAKWVARAAGVERVVPCAPELTAISILVRTGARGLTFTPKVASTPLAKRPYDVRHAEPSWTQRRRVPAGVGAKRLDDREQTAERGSADHGPAER